MYKFKLIEKFKNCKNVCLISHIQPDADALCSLVVLRKFLIENFKINNVDIFAECERLPEIYKPILVGAKLNPKLKKYDGAIIIDCPSIARTGTYSSLFVNAETKLNIDHHPTNEFKNDERIFDVVSSCCEILYLLLKKYNYTFNNFVLGRIYAGIITDTNNFSVGAITKTTLEIAGACLTSVKPEIIYNQFLNNYSLVNQQVYAKAINNIISLENGKILISYISPKQQNEIGATFDDMFGISGNLRQISGCCLACFVSAKNNLFNVSLRARQSFDVSKIAKAHGGGGHVGASAYLSDKNLDETLHEIESDLIKELKSGKATKIKVFND